MSEIENLEEQLAKSFEGFDYLIYRLRIDKDFLDEFVEPDIIIDMQR
jgi:hypothetical protein